MFIFIGMIDLICKIHRLRFENGTCILVYKKKYFSVGLLQLVVLMKKYLTNAYFCIKYRFKNFPNLCL